MSATYLLGLVFSFFVLLMIFLRLRNSRMKERYATLWIVIALAVLLISVFPGLLEGAARLLGIAVPLNLGLFLAGIVLLLVSLQYSVDLSHAQEERRRLTEEIALQRARTDALEQRLAAMEKRDRT